MPILFKSLVYGAVSKVTETLNQVLLQFITLFSILLQPTKWSKGLIQPHFRVTLTLDHRITIELIGHEKQSANSGKM